MVTFNTSCNYKLVVLLCIAVDGTWFSSQLDGLGYGRQRRRDCLNRHLTLTSKSPLPDLVSKGADDDVALEWFHVGEGWGDTAGCGKVGPFLPVFLPLVGSFNNDAKANCPPRRHDVMREIRALGNWNTFQDSPCVNGKCC